LGEGLGEQHKEAKRALADKVRQLRIELTELQTTLTEFQRVLAADKTKVIDLPPILRRRIDLPITRVHTRSTRDHRPILGDYASSCGSWSL
jgi:hypothetical protein